MEALRFFIKKIPRFRKKSFRTFWFDIISLENDSWIMSVAHSNQERRILMLNLKSKVLISSSLLLLIGIGWSTGRLFEKTPQVSSKPTIKLTISNYSELNRSDNKTFKFLRMLTKSKLHQLLTKQLAEGTQTLRFKNQATKKWRQFRKRIMG